MASGGLTSQQVGSRRQSREMRLRRGAWVITFNSVALGASHAALLLSPNSRAGPLTSWRLLAIASRYYEVLSQVFMLIASHWNLACHELHVNLHPAWKIQMCLKGHALVSISAYWLRWAECVPTQPFLQHRGCFAFSHCISRSKRKNSHPSSFP